jgi:tetratricopeptide (TPR) repeat protein
MSSKTISNFPIIYFEIHNYPDEVGKALLLDEEDIVSAIEIYESFRDKYPDNYSILNNLGLLYFKEEKFKKAVSCLQLACSKADKTFISECHTNLGQILFALKKYEEAREVFYKGIANNTGGFRLFPLERYARILEAIGKHEDAIDVYMGLTKEYEDAWDYDYFDSVFLWDGLGYCYSKLDKLKKAGNAYQKAKTIEDMRIAEILNSLKRENEIEPKREKLKNTKEYRSREKKIAYINGKIDERLNTRELLKLHSDRIKENIKVKTNLNRIKTSKGTISENLIENHEIFSIIMIPRSGGKANNKIVVNDKQIVDFQNTGFDFLYYLLWLKVNKPDGMDYFKLDEGIPAEHLKELLPGTNNKKLRRFKYSWSNHSIPRQREKNTQATNINKKIKKGSRISFDIIVSGYENHYVSNSISDENIKLSLFSKMI